MSEQVKNKGWLVTFSGMGVNLALGVLYSWSILKANIEGLVKDGTWAWNPADVNDPYALSCLVFALIMVPAGRMLDKIGPRITSTIGGVLAGIGLVICSQSTSYVAWIVGFGVFFGAAMGMSYASTTPAAVKWFPPSKTGLIAGLVVAGFGLASAYIAPLGTWLIGTYGISQAMLIMAIGFGIVVVGLSQLLIVPPAGYKPVETKDMSNSKVAVSKDSFTWKQMMASPVFYVLWLVYLIGSGAGLMVISQASGMAKAALAEYAFLAVLVLAIGNASGRIAAGLLSDKIGRKATLIIMLTFQAGLMFLFPSLPTDSVFWMLVIPTFLGFNYGSNLSLFPSITKDFFGLKSFGLNYGIVFTAWGVGGLVLPKISQAIKVANNGDLTWAFYTAGLLLIGAGLLSLFIKAPKPHTA